MAEMQTPLQVLDDAPPAICDRAKPSELPWIAAQNHRLSCQRAAPRFAKPRRALESSHNVSRASGREGPRVSSKPPRLRSPGSVCCERGFCFLR